MKCELSIFNDNNEYNILYKRDMSKLSRNVCKNLNPPTPSALALINTFGAIYRDEDFVCKKQILGNGFFATVYKIQTIKNKQVMALKVPKATEFMNRFIKEVILLKSLSHSSILKYYGTCVFEGEFGCLTEYLNSGDLSTLIKSQGNMKWQLTVDIAENISSGLSYLHQSFIVHRDLSSENILLDKYSKDGNVRYRAVIADLGLFLNLKSDNCDKISSVGNPYYTAPENLTNTSPYNFSSDIFSFGLILCELITGLKNDPSVIPRTKNYGVDYAKLPVRHDCPKWLQNLACNCCKVHIQQRPSTNEVYQTISNNKPYIGLWTCVRLPNNETTSASNSNFRSNNINFNHSLNGGAVNQTTLSSKRDSRCVSVGNKCSGLVKRITRKQSMNPTAFRNDKPLQSQLHWHHNSLDSFLEPSHLNMTKANEDPGYTDTPLSSSDRYICRRRSPSVCAIGANNINCNNSNKALFNGNSFFSSTSDSDILGRTSNSFDDDYDDDDVVVDSDYSNRHDISGIGNNNRIVLFRNSCNKQTEADNNDVLE